MPLSIVSMKIGEKENVHMSLLMRFTLSLKMKKVQPSLHLHGDNSVKEMPILQE